MAAAVLFLLASGTVMYVPGLSELVGQRFWVRTSHLAAAILLVAMVLMIPALRWGEVTGLECEHTHPAEICVEWQLREIRGTFHRIPPKDDSSGPKDGSVIL